MRSARVVLRVLSIFSVLSISCSARRPHPTVADRNVAACARAAGGLACALWQGLTFGDPTLWSSAFGYSGDSGESSGAPFASPDLDGDGQSDICIEDRVGLSCALRIGPESFGAEWRNVSFAESSGFGDWTSRSRILFPDVDGDGLPDACARRSAGLFCAHGHGNGMFDPATPWAETPFRDVDGSGDPSRYQTLRFGDLDGDGRDDVCIGTGTGVSCALERDHRFAAATAWSTGFIDAPGAATKWELVDFDGDGRMDLCGLDSGAVFCARSDGTRFVDVAASLPVGAGMTARFADVNADGRSDVCLSGADGINCATSDGSSFAPDPNWHVPAARGAAATITWLVDVNGDGRADLCHRGTAGLACSLSDGARFAVSIAQAAFGDDDALDRDLDVHAISIGASVGVSVARNPTAAENQRLGARNWWVPYPQWSTQHEVEAYTDQLSYTPGQRVSVLLSTSHRGDHVSWTLLRTGWYGGRGARRVAQGAVDGSPQLLPAAATQTSEPVRANWKPTFSIAVPPDAVSGVYVLRLDSAATRKSFFVTLVVRDDERISDLLFERADFTDAAYNAWDGTSNTSSLYNGARWVSFDRPLRSVGALGIYSYSSGYFIYEYPMVRWLESQGYDVAYVSDVDVHRDAGTLSRAGAFLSVGHDEYWSAAKRDHVEAARDAGVHLGFFGSDMVDGLIRFKPGDPRSFSRSISDSNSRKNEFANFPLDLSRPAHENPSDSITGTHYLDWCSAAFPECLSGGAGKLRVADDLRIDEPDHPVFRGIAGTTEPLPRVLGYEYEAPYSDLTALPFTLHVLARAANVRVNQIAPVMVAYRAASGALVANIGSMHWAHALDPWVGRAALRTTGGERNCQPGARHCFSRLAPAVAQVTTNIMIDFSAAPTTPSENLALSSSRVWP